MFAFLLLVLILSLVAYWKLASSYSYWKKKGIPHPKPSIIFGSLKPAFTFQKSLGKTYTELYNEFKGLRYFGIYKIRTPGVLIRDVELLKEILIKDFASFHDNDIEINSETDFLANNPFVLKGAKWKSTRTQLTSSFTSGKIKSIFPLMGAVSKNLINYLDNEPEITGKNGTEVKELTSKFTTDAVATCAYGIEANSFKDPNAEFRTMGRRMTTPSFWLGIQHLLIFILPWLASILHISFIPDDIANWFQKIVYEMVEYREKNKISRNDFIDMMIKLKSQPQEYEFTNRQIAGHCASFFIDGFETSSGAIAFALYELAANPDVQTKLRAEIDRVLEKHEGKITYDSINDMTYLDCIFMETLRKDPPGLFLVKTCTQQYTLPPFREDGTGKMLTIEPGTPVVIPIQGIHMDPKYFPDPERFDPERFNEENKQSIPKCAYLAFGEGPRACLGQRFAIAQSKMAIVTIISNYVLRVNPKTIQPIQEDPKYFMLSAKGGLWLNFYKRTDKAVI